MGERKRIMGFSAYGNSPEPSVEEKETKADYTRMALDQYLADYKPYNPEEEDVHCDYKTSKEIQNDLKAPGANVYARVDCVADWFLLSRMYLNAKTWIGEDRYDDALTYAKKVIEDGHYPLASDYRHIFLADNDECKEIIWPLVQDGLKAQSSGGTNFYVKAFVNGPMNELYNTGIGSRGWGNVRAKTTLVDAFDADDVMFDVNDPWGNNKKDKRAQFMTALPNQVKETWDSKDAMTSTYTCGYGYIKWRNVTKDDQIPASGDAYTSIDFPLFRTGEAYLTAAEAILRGAKGSKAEALKYVNEIRERAYMSGKYAKEGVRSDVSGDIEESELTLDFLMAERQRELASELVRRTDLIRFGKYTKVFTRRSGLTCCSSNLRYSSTQGPFSP